MIASRLSTDLYGKYIGRFLLFLLVPEYCTSSSYQVLKNPPSRLSTSFVCPYSFLRLFVPFLIHTSFASIQACFAIERSIGRRFRLISTIGAAVSQWIAEFKTRLISTISGLLLVCNVGERQPCNQAPPVTQVEARQAGNRFQTKVELIKRLGWVDRTQE